MTKQNRRLKDGHGNERQPENSQCPFTVLKKVSKSPALTECRIARMILWEKIITMRQDIMTTTLSFTANLLRKLVAVSRQFLLLFR